jgi:hypothetical protein
MLGPDRFEFLGPGGGVTDGLGEKPPRKRRNPSGTEKIVINCGSPASRRPPPFVNPVVFAV